MMQLPMTHSAPITKQKLYWIFQLAGWFSLMFMETFNYTFFINESFQWNYFYYFGIFPLIGLIVTHFYRKLFIPKTIFTKSYGKIWLRAALDALAITFFMVLIGTLIGMLTRFSISELNIKDAILRVGPQFMNIARYVVVWIVVYYLFHILMHNNAVLAEKMEAENKAMNAELDLLKTQLNPAFLFHSLSSIKTLMLQSKETARDGIVQLSELLRYSLNYERNSLVSIREELEEMQKYLKLEKLRFGARLQLNSEISKDCLERTIPPASLILMMEYAIQYGVELEEKTEDIALIINQTEDSLTIAIDFHSNSKSLKLNEGLINLKIRLRKIFGQQAQLLLEKIVANKNILKLIINQV